jgi:hypothetical protein
MAGEIGAPADALLGSVPKTSRAASPGATSKAALVPVIAPDAARSVYPVPLLSMLRSSKTATPATAVTDWVPDSVAPSVPVPVVMDTMTAPAKFTSTLSWSSRASTSRAGVIAAPAVAALGSTE